MVLRFVAFFSIIAAIFSCKSRDVDSNLNDISNHSYNIYFQLDEISVGDYSDNLKIGYNLFYWDYPNQKWVAMVNATESRAAFTVSYTHLTLPTIYSV